MHVLQAVEGENKPVIKRKQNVQVFALPKQLKTVKSPENSLCSDQKDLEVSTEEIPLLNEVGLSKQRRLKMSLQRTLRPKEKSSENILKSQLNKHSTQKVHVFS